MVTVRGGENTITGAEEQRVAERELRAGAGENARIYRFGVLTFFLDFGVLENFALRNPDAVLTFQCRKQVVPSMIKAMNPIKLDETTNPVGSSDDQIKRGNQLHITTYCSTIREKLA
ncbi:hypothetical protein L1887_15196 [Cichorium endivia]|nr:hypothetical protein L1887_15196 [Cichorium endivia]